jgi:hypothetical protein
LLHRISIEPEMNAFYEAAMAAGATDNGKPSACLYYDPPNSLQTMRETAEN